MQQMIPWLAFGVGALAIGLSLLRTDIKGRLPRVAQPYLGMAMGLVVLGALLTLPVQAPFSPGQTLGPGMLLGGLAVLLGMVVMPAGDRPGAALVWSGRIGSVVCGISLLLVFYSSRILDALSGFSLGAMLVGVVAGGGLALAASRAADEDLVTSSLPRGAEAAALIAVTLASATYLATFHRSPSGAREWQALPVLLAAAAALLLAARSAAGTPRERGWLYDLALIPIPLVVIGWLIAYQLHGSAGFLKVILVGFVVFGMVGWLDRTAAARAAEGPTVRRLDAAMLMGLLALGGAVIAFRELNGYGLALMTLAALLLYPVLFAEEEAQAPAGRLYLNAIMVGMLMTLYRVFTERNEYLRGFQPDFLYYYVALILGALLPGLLAGLAEDTMTVDADQSLTTVSPAGRSFSALARVLLVAAISLLAPLAVWLLIGDRPQAALLVGLAVGVVMLPAREDTGGAARAPVWRLSAALMAISAVQLTHLLTPLALRTRGQRLSVLAVVAVVALLAIAATAWRESRLRSARSS